MRQPANFFESLSTLSLLALGTATVLTTSKPEHSADPTVANAFDGRTAVSRDIELFLAIAHPGFLVGRERSGAKTRRAFEDIRRYPG